MLSDALWGNHHIIPGNSIKGDHYVPKEGISGNAGRYKTLEGGNRVVSLPSAVRT